MTPIEEAERQLRGEPRTWLVTGAAGFIGSNLVEALLELGQTVVGLDNFSTGRRRNVELVRDAVGEKAANFRFVEGDIRDIDTCGQACETADVVLHQAALGSVPRSIDNPLDTHSANVDGLVNMLLSARDAGVDRFVYASSSSVYGDDESLPKVEDRIGRPVSPYAASKRMGEVYAGAFQQTYGLEIVGLRYFNVFGPRQNPDGPYAAVIPRWIRFLLNGKRCPIYGDGETSRDFCYVENVVQANILAALAPSGATDAIYNVACGTRTTLDELFRLIRDGLAEQIPSLADSEPVYEPFRPGDVRHTLADISRIREELGYRPTHQIDDGLEEALDWYVSELAPASSRTG